MGARKAAEAKGRHRRKPTQLDREKLAPVLAELMDIGNGAEPCQVLGHFDRAGHCRRITADYPNGWRLIVRLNVKLVVTSCCASIRLSTSLRAKSGG